MTSTVSLVQSECRLQSTHVTIKIQETRLNEVDRHYTHESAWVSIISQNLKQSQIHMHQFKSILEYLVDVLYRIPCQLHGIKRSKFVRVMLLTFFLRIVLDYIRSFSMLLTFFSQNSNILYTVLLCNPFHIFE